MRSGKLLTLSCAVAMGCLGATAAWAQDQAFQIELSQKADRYDSELTRTPDLAHSDINEATKVLMDLVDKDKSPALMLAVGNVLFNLDRATSYSLHKKVYDAKPMEPDVILEWAMERHRKGEYAEATPLYQQFLDLVKDEPQINALLADCLVEQGKLSEAVASWDAGAHATNHEAIDLAINDIYGDISPLRRRADLLNRVKNKEVDAAEKLIALDLSMDQDWWNIDIDDDALGRDLPVIDAVLGPDSKRAKAIHCWVDIELQDTIASAPVLKLLEDAGLIVEKGALPESSIVAEGLIDAVVEVKLQTKDQLFERFDKELTERSKSKAGDIDALRILCNLSSENKERSENLNRFGWERYADARFAVALLNQLQSEKKLEHDSPDLKKALTQFPDNGVVQNLSILTMDESDVTQNQLVAAIKAEYHHLSPGLDGQPDSYTLNAHFKLLKAKL
jgi:tetratricopeptide (TPR) repeat protein